MTNPETLSALFDDYVAAGRDVRELENKWRESNIDFQLAEERMLCAWQKYKFEKNRQEKKEKP
jgi:hypothetical protein